MIFSLILVFAGSPVMLVTSINPPPKGLKLTKGCEVAPIDTFAELNALITLVPRILDFPVDILLLSTGTPEASTVISISIRFSTRFSTVR